MPQTCILTDITAHFPTPQFSGSEHVYSLPLRVTLHNTDQPLPQGNLPGSPINGLRPKLHPPESQEVQSTLLSLSKKYHEIVAILPSKHLSPSFNFIQTLTTEINSKTSLRLIDTHTTSIGLGLLVQRAARVAVTGIGGAEILREIHQMTQRVYTVFFTRNLTYLYHAGFLDPGQAIIGEMLGLIPLFLFDGKHPVCLQKTQNPRQMIRALFEFIEEFEQLDYIGIIRNPQAFELITRNLLRKLPLQFPTARFSVHPLESTLSAVLGPQSLGLVALEAQI